MENNNEIKKYLLKNKPKAQFQYIRKGNAYYKIDVYKDNGFLAVGQITFEIPMSDMGEADFKAEMDGNLLMRWIYSFTIIK